MFTLMVGHMLFFHFESALVGLETLPVGFDRADAVEFKDISLSCFASRLNFVRCFAKEPTDNFLLVFCAFVRRDLRTL